MNYPSFLKAVNQLVEKSSSASLAFFISELARRTPEKDRSAFLELLRSACEPLDPLALSEGEPGALGDEDAEESTLEEDVEEAMAILEEIEEGVYCLESEINEEWDDWYDSMDEEFLFTDPDDILEDIEHTVELIHICLDMGEYDRGANLALALSSMELLITGEYDEERIDLEGLIDHNLLEVDMPRLVMDSLCLVYMFSAEQGEEEQVAEMLEIVSNYRDRSFTLDKFLQAVPVRVDLESFLPAWIDALGEATGDKENTLFLEAVGMLSDPERVLELASEFAEKHPDLYRRIMDGEMLSLKPAQRLSVGLQAGKEMEHRTQVRAHIFLQTARAALEEGQVSVAEECWLEAFKDQPTVVNFLRLRVEVESWVEYASEVRRIYESLNPQEYAYRKSVPMMMFFDRRFEEVQERFMNPGSGIGWSYTFMKEGMALMLLLLNKGKAGPGIRVMQSKAIGDGLFEAGAYLKGTLLPPCPEGECFTRCFEKWKKEIPFSQEVADQWLDRLGGWISLRVKAIMEANRRNYYGECAAFIAALGEVQESWGKKGAKAMRMAEYKAAYSRRRAFHEEMRRF